MKTGYLDLENQIISKAKSLYDAEKTKFWMLALDFSSERKQIHRKHDFSKVKGTSG